MANLAGVAQDDHERGGEAELGGNLRPPPIESFPSYFLLTLSFIDHLHFQSLPDQFFIHFR